MAKLCKRLQVNVWRENSSSNNLTDLNRVATGKRNSNAEKNSNITGVCHIVKCNVYYLRRKISRFT